MSVLRPFALTAYPAGSVAGVPEPLPAFLGRRRGASWTSGQFITGQSLCAPMKTEFSFCATFCAT